MAKKKNIKNDNIEINEEVNEELTEGTTEILDGELSEEFMAEGLLVEEETASFLPEATEEDVFEEPISEELVEGSELEAFESAEIEDIEFLEEERMDSVIESVLFASDRPVTLASLKLLFKGTNIKGDKIKRALDRLAVELAGARRGVTLEEVPGGFQIRTKIDNMDFIARSVKARQFRLSGPALEVLAIIAYKQPVIKAELDEIRGVESGHLLRALMEKGLATFEGKSDLPGKPMQYGTTKKFLEIFGLRNLKELPTLSQIDELLPEGITEEEGEKQTLSQLTDKLSENIGSSYSIGEEELGKIEGQLAEINTSSDFFEQEKNRQKQKRDEEKAQGIRDAILLGEEVSNRDRNWLERYETALSQGTAAQFTAEETAVEQASAMVAEKIEEAASEEGLFSEEADLSVDADMGLEYSDDEAEA